MQILDKETVLKLKTMPPERQKQILDGLAKIFAARPHSFLGEPQCMFRENAPNDVHRQRQG